jgi:hypothetical protein
MQSRQSSLALLDLSLACLVCFASLTRESNSPRNILLENSVLMRLRRAAVLFSAEDRSVKHQERFPDALKTHADWRSLARLLFKLHRRVLSRCRMQPLAVLVNVDELLHVFWQFL